MKILISTPFCYPGEGGLDTHVSMLVKGLSQNGHKVEILSLSSMPVWLRKATLTGPAFVLNKIALGWGYVFFFKLLPIYFSIILYSMFKKYSFEVLNVQYVGLVAIAKKIASWCGFSVVLTVHGDFTNELLSEKKIKKNSKVEEILLRLEKRGYEKADRIVTVDQRLREHVEKFIGKNQKIISIQNFVDTALFSPELKVNHQNIKGKWSIPLDKKVILCPRRLAKKNGVVGAALAMDYIVNEKKRRDLVLVYAGEGGERAEIEKIIKQKTLEPYVKFLGGIKHSEIHYLYGVAEVVVIPSTYSEGVMEATSIAALEAMASGIPVVATKIGGLVEIIEDGKSGVLFPDKDYRILAESILKIVDDKELSYNLGMEGRKRVMEKNSLPKGSEQFLGVYGQALRDFNSLMNLKSKTFS